MPPRILALALWVCGGIALAAGKAEIPAAPPTRSSALGVPTETNPVSPIAPVTTPSLSAPHTPIAAPSLPSEIPAAAEMPAAAPAAAIPALSSLPEKNDLPITTPPSPNETIEKEVLSWGPERHPEIIAQAGQISDPTASVLRRTRNSSHAEEPPIPVSPRPKTARVAGVVGAGLLAAAAAAFGLPGLFAALGAVKGPLTWLGLVLLVAWRYWRKPALTPTAAPENAAAKNARWRKHVPGFAAAWDSAAAAADAMPRWEARVGGGSAVAFRDWLMGGFKAALNWIPVTLGAMLGGAVIGKALANLAHAGPAATADSSVLFSLTGLDVLMGPIASSLAQQAGVLLVFDGIRRLLAGRVSLRSEMLGAGAVSLAISAALLATFTTNPFVLAASLAVDASFLWLRARSKSWLAPLAAQGMFTLIAMESGRTGAWLNHAAVAALAGLPAVWPGLAVGGLLLGGLAWSAGSLRPAALWSAFRGSLDELSIFGKSWRAPSADGRPKSPWPLFRLAALWGTALYAIGEVFYAVMHALIGGVEPAPVALVRMFTAPLDLVFFNMLFVGFFEEFLFRRNVFRPLRDWLARRGWSGSRAFWTAAVLSGMFFSGTHYVDYTGVIAHLGFGKAFASSGLATVYAFTWAGFLTRSMLGVVLAGLYARSGLLILPILAHACNDLFEGLGLRWGVGPFLAICAAAVLAKLFADKRRA